MSLDFTAPGGPPRADLGFLRRRRPAAAPVSGGGTLDLSGGVAPPFGGEPVPASAAAQVLGDAPIERGGGSPGGVSLDLGGEPVPAGVSLNVAARPVVPDARPEPPRCRSGRPGRPVVRVRPRGRLQLGPKTPAVTLDRRQSAIGLLTVEAVGAAAAFGCAYDLTDGRSAYLGSGTTATRTPFLAVRRRSVSADLRQVRQLVRLVVLAVFPPSQAPPGLLVVSTWDGATLELPLGKPAAGRVTVPLSVHNVGGELVLRAETAEAFTSPRAAVDAFGFHRIGWLDDATCAGSGA
ncbi:hypothetical protein ACIRSS_17915 [Amycolatopsis sp. NPDC101161]|uniref:hypothetical protein n=1 Tax=Amycolatopsis sp. NPDC101161 TaxID=3363940 RepID=UPI00382F5052